MTEFEIAHGLSQDAPGPLEPVEVAKVPAGMHTEWKPIASAPKDGTRVLLWNEKFTAPCSGQFYGFDDWKMDSDIPPFAFQPTHWMPLPPAPTSHPIPTGATGERDWELSCDECNGSGHVFVKHQVAERKTDVQEFKEECEICAGRGFNIAFEDIPGIAEYVKSCQPAATVATGDAQQRLSLGVVLGLGEYIIQTTASGEAAQIVFSQASDHDRATRTIGDLKIGGHGPFDHSRIRGQIMFTSAAGLDALEVQLRELRKEHWPETVDAAPAAGDALALLEKLEAWQSVCDRIVDQYGGVVAGVDFGALGRANRAAIAQQSQRKEET